MAGGQFEDDVAKILVFFNHLYDINSVIFNYTSYFDVA